MSPRPLADCGADHGSTARCACGATYVPKSCKQKCCGASLCTRRLEREKNGQVMRADLPDATCMYCKATFRPKSKRNVKACSLAECQHKRKSRVVVHEDRACAICAAAFVPLTARNVLCSSSSCKKAARDQRFAAWYAKPINVETHRDKTRVRMATARGAIISTAETSRQPWLLAVPAYGSHLPGGGLEIAISPPPKWPISHRNVRALHGLLTTLIDEPHDTCVPGFSLVPWHVRSGWGVYIRDAEHAARLAGKSFQGRLFDREVTISFSTVRRIRAPQIVKRGRALVRIDAVTPVCIRNGGGSTTYTAPIAANLLSAIVQSFPQRIGLVGLDPASAQLEIVERHTEPATVQLGGKFASIRGWTGHVVVEANAVARWLLACAGLIGLGGRTALGFGRMRVSEVETATAPVTKAARRFFVTPHAIDRFREHYRPDLSENTALSLLIQMTSEGSLVGPCKGEHLSKLPGAQMWRTPRERVPGGGQTATSRMRFVVAHGEGDLAQVVTVLPRQHEDGRARG